VSDDTTVTFSENGLGVDQADVAIAVVGEDPYAEYFGDTRSLTIPRDDIRTITHLKAAGIPVVVVLLSGRPVIIEQELPNWNALIAAWLPGTEGQGVTDVLFGDYNPTGRLPHSWPRNIAQTPINVGDYPYEPLFPYGFGLSYSSIPSE